MFNSHTWRNSNNETFLAAEGLDCHEIRNDIDVDATFQHFSNMNIYRPKGFYVLMNEDG